MKKLRKDLTLAEARKYLDLTVDLANNKVDYIIKPEFEHWCNRTNCNIWILTDMYIIDDLFEEIPIDPHIQIYVTVSLVFNSEEDQAIFLLAHQ